ncbi:Piso0_002829 [Millerozyma farinosa CBS 7064]|uniref:Galactose-1-phosphate uridylyltransferase n=1 Tax=Pichia sorbitophila (strain ATCC MYA-4447 / BCRC 22081 / CBS 7064 / NBRC 10061 / NRRL Y-12695) TaxID=559304 RepID=G8YG32_PICSO|nr:Piso0_002829 [Millerozyma farinosa CBS 7064]
MSQNLPFDVNNHSHRRLNPLTNSYVLCSPHRAKRPWQGARDEVRKNVLPEFDPKCYLCPGNVRATGDSNPKYSDTYVFLNDYPAVRDDQPDYIEDKDLEKKNPVKARLLKTKGVRGRCFVICFSPNHSLTMALMPQPSIVKVVETWSKLYNDLYTSSKNKENDFAYLQIFENRGFAMGCSNPHPHGQAWCLNTIPTEVQTELDNMKAYKKENGSHLLGDYVSLELQEKQRVVLSNDSFIVVVPYWALWPFETLLISKEHLRSLNDFNDKQKSDLASILKKLTTKYDNLFNTSFPYSMGLHQAPFISSEDETECSWFHIHFYPPLLRSATVKKFCVGFEMLGEPQRDLTSEQAASRLQDLDSEVHYLDKLAHDQ